ncbi:MAG: TetR family transcriptional regulator [Thermoleophilia bacterium]|nr:TetR family transcriptional regulator [Thermoleophilia bacterium]
MHDDADSGLRERKKAATRLAIEQAAVDIACTQGYEAATAEAISARAEVSLRTFFNYFPSKDLAITGGGLIQIGEEEAHRTLEDAGADLLKGIARVVEACVVETDPASALMRRRRRLVHQNPRLFHLHVIGEAQFDDWLAEVVAGHLHNHPPRRRLSRRATVEEEAKLAVMMVSSAVHYQVRRAIEKDIDIALSEKDIEDTIDLMAEIHRKEP